MTMLIKAAHVQVSAGRKPLGTTPDSARPTDLAVPASGVAAQRVAAQRDGVWPIDTQAIATSHAFKPAATDAETAALTTQLAELERAYAALEASADADKEAAYKKGLDDGSVAGEARAARDHAARLDALKHGVSEARLAFQEQLVTVESLALDIARTALERIFGDPDLHASLIAQTARHHLTQLAAGSALSIEVSAEDFPQQAQLREAFAALIETSELSVAANPQLPAGACLIGLSLGKLDVGLPQQYGRISAALTELRPHDEQPAS